MINCKTRLLVLATVFLCLVGGFLLVPERDQSMVESSASPKRGEEFLPTLPPVRLNEPGDVLLSAIVGTEMDDVREIQLISRQMTVANVGEFVNPDDPLTWPQREYIEPVNVGAPMDPDDPSTRPQREYTEALNVGEPMSPDDPTAWPQNEHVDVVNVGGQINLDEPPRWPKKGSSEIINVGAPMDPDKG